MKYFLGKQGSKKQQITFKNQTPIKTKSFFQVKLTENTSQFLQTNIVRSLIIGEGK